MSERFQVALPPDLVERIAERAAELLEERTTAAGEWLSLEEAAAYARCKPQRIYDLRSCGRLPRTGDGSRVLVRRSDLDAYLARQ